MKTSSPCSFAALGLSAMMLWLPTGACAQQYAPQSSAQPSYSFPQLDMTSIQEQGDEMSRRVGNFFKKLFNSDDQGQGGYQPPQRYQQAPPSQPRRYQQAPPPSQSGNPAPPRKSPPPQQAAAPQRKPPSRDTEPEKPKRKEAPALATSNKSSPKKPAPEDKPAPRPAKREEEPPAKPVAKRKIVAEDEAPKPPVKKTPEPSAPKKDSNTVKVPVRTESPPSVASKKSEPSKEPKSSPPSGNSDTGSLSPYADGYNGGSTLMAPKDSIASKPPAKKEEPKKEAETPAGSDIYPVGTRNPDHPGAVVSPYPPHNELDVSGLSSGSLAVDPTTKKVFRIP